MPKLTITAKTGSVSVQDPFPADGQLVLEVPSGTTENIDVTWSQLQRLRPMLTSLEVGGFISYGVEATDLDARAEEADLAGLPYVSGMDLATTALAAGAVTGAKVLGTGLLAGQTKATCQVGNTSDANGYIDIEAILPGSESNDYSVAIDPSLSGTGPTVAVVAGKITVSVDPATADYTAVAGAINGDAVAKTMVKATAGGTGASLATTAYDVQLTGGQGGGIALTLGGVSATITATSDAEVVYDADLSGLTTGDFAAIEFRSGAKLTRMGAVLA